MRLLSVRLMVSLMVGITAPSRTHMKRYHDLLAEVEAEAERIKWRFQSGKWKPIVFLKRYHNHEDRVTAA
jgi:trehalose-6-phosphate synthase